MTAILISGVVGLVGTLLGTPLLIRYLHAKEYGQFIRQDGPQGHFTKRGTPTMGGLVIIISTVLGYTLANLSQLRTPRASGVLLLFLVVGLGLIGFLDDFEKISKQRSLGLRAWQKIVGQALIGIGFSVAALHFADRNGLTPASAPISFAPDSAINPAFARSAAGHARARCRGGGGSCEAVARRSLRRRGVGRVGRGLAVGRAGGDLAVGRVGRARPMISGR